MSILHVLDHSLPEQSGYAYRSHAILRELQKQDLAVDVLTSPKQGVERERESLIDGIRYQRTPPGGDEVTSGVFGQLHTIRATRRQIRKIVRTGSHRLIHAHSPCLNGLAALGLGLPLVYEMRSSWEDAAVSVGRTTAGSLRYRVSKALETFVVRRADAVVVICEGLRQELLARGVPDEKITVVPNALPPEVFELPEEKSMSEVRRRYSQDDAWIIGFFGSFFEWEGIDELIRALPAVIERVPKAHLLLAGGGRQEPALRELVDRLGLESRVTFAGRVPHDEVMALYGAVDVVAFPRVQDRLTDMVTPIKPLEAMAQGTIVVASDVGGHRELVQHEQTGFLYRAGDRGALARALVDVAEAGKHLGDVRAKARQFVEEERQWAVVSRRYGPLYERFGGIGVD